MGKRILLTAFTAVMLGGFGCVHHVVHPHPMVPPGHLKHHVKHVTQLNDEHANTQVVVIHEKPHSKRHCWSHGHHWHCRK